MPIRLFYLASYLYVQVATYHTEVVLARQTAPSNLSPKSSCVNNQGYPTSACGHSVKYRKICITCARCE